MNHDGWIIAWIYKSMLVHLHNWIIIVCNHDVWIDIYDGSMSTYHNTFVWFWWLYDLWFHPFNCLSSCFMSLIHLPYLFITLSPRSQNTNIYLTKIHYLYVFLARLIFLNHYPSLKTLIVHHLCMCEFLCH